MRGAVWVCGKCYALRLARCTVVNIARLSASSPPSRSASRALSSRSHVPIGGAVQRGAECPRSRVGLRFECSRQDPQRGLNSRACPWSFSATAEMLLRDDVGRGRPPSRALWPPICLPTTRHRRQGPIAGGVGPHPSRYHRRDGHRAYIDLTEGLSGARSSRRRQGSHRNVVMTGSRQPRWQRSEATITLRDQMDEVLTLAQWHGAATSCRWIAILSVKNGAEVKAGERLARLPRDTVEDSRYYRWSPRVSGLRPETEGFAIISDIDAASSSQDYRPKRRILWCRA